MTIKELREKVNTALSVQISIHDEDWKRLGHDAKVIEVTGTPEEVNRATVKLINDGMLVAAKTVAIVLFANSEDSFQVMGAIPTEDLSASGANLFYGICCNPLESGKVEMYIGHN